MNQMITALPQSNPAATNGVIQTMIPVLPGDFGTKYELLDGLDQSRNRDLDLERVKLYGRDLEGIATTTVELITHQGRNFIADGQHRICAISTFAQEPMWIFAKIRDLQSVIKLKGSVARFVWDLNASKQMGTMGKLSVIKDVSPWPKALSFLCGRELPFKAGRSTASWFAVMRAVAGYRQSLLKGRFIQGQATEATILDVFSNASEPFVIDVITRLGPWLAITDQAKSARKISSLYSFVPLQVWLLVCWWRSERSSQIAE